MRWWSEGQDSKLWYTRTMRQAAFELERQAKEVESLTAERDQLIDGLKLVRGIIAEGTMTGFNPLDGDWATRLFESQGFTYKMVKGR